MNAVVRQMKSFLSSCEKSLRNQRLNQLSRKRIFTLALLLPTVLTFIYFLMIASPMYVSKTSFAIRATDQSVATSEIASIFVKGAGGTGNDSYILDDYIRSQDIADDVDKELSVRSHYSDKQYDVISRLSKEATKEDWLDYWNFVISPQLNVDTGIITVEVRAYTPEMAQKIAQSILHHSEALVNAMNERAQSDALELAKKEVVLAEARIKKAQSALREFRNTHALIDPATTATGLQSIVSTLEAEAATLRTKILDSKAYMRKDSPLLTSLYQRLNAVEEELKAERERVAGKGSTSGNLNSVLAEYEELALEAEFAQKQLLSVMTSLEQARVQKASQSRYVVAHQRPTLPDESLYPKPFLFTLFVFLGLLVVLGLISLIWASIREHAGF